MVGTPTKEKSFSSLENEFLEKMGWKFEKWQLF